MQIPHNWIVFKSTECYKLLMGWSGGYLIEDTWKVNSGITNVTKDGEYFVFEGISSSKYHCHENTYRLANNNIEIWNKIKDQVKMLPEKTDWVEFDWVRHE